ncbi:MAG: hypothetical protein M1150_04530 [Patescibacteria group bacterium]|nr:hypothetical protein [Patescibacteria group bacterium]
MEYKTKKKRGLGQKVLFIVILALVAIVVIWRFGLSSDQKKTTIHVSNQNQSTVSAQTTKLSPQDLSFISGIITTEGRSRIAKENNVNVQSIRISTNPTFNGQIAYVPLEITTDKEKVKPQRFVAMMVKEGNFWQTLSIKKVD